MKFMLRYARGVYDPNIATLVFMKRSYIIVLTTTDPRSDILSIPLMLSLTALFTPTMSGMSQVQCVADHGPPPPYA